MANILQTGTYCSSNKGDAAMEFSMARALQSHLPGIGITIPQIDGHAVKPGPCDHLADLIKGQLDPRLVMRLHRPERGVDLKPPHSAGTRRVRPPDTGTTQTSFIG